MSEYIIIPEDEDSLDDKNQIILVPIGKNEEGSCLFYTGTRCHFPTFKTLIFKIQTNSMTILYIQSSKQ